MVGDPTDRIFPPRTAARRNKSRRSLLGANPGELPLEQPNVEEMVLNLKTATALGLTIPQAVRLRADDVIR